MSIAESVVEELVAEQPGTELVEIKKFDQQLAEFTAKYSNVVYDLTDPAVEKQARSDRYAIGKVVGDLDRKHAEVKAPLLERARILDAERKRIKDALQGVQDGIKSQIEEHEARIKARREALEARIAAISALAVFETVPDSIDIRCRIEDVADVVIDATFGEMEPRAALVKTNTLETLERLLADAVAKEKADAEARRLDEEERAWRQEVARQEAEAAAAAQAERDKKIAEEASAKAKQEADAALEAQREATAKAEQAARDTAERAKKQAAEAAARADQEKADAVAAAKKEEQEKAAQAERDRLAAIERERAEEERRQADQAHRLQVQSEAVAALTLCFDIGIDRAAGIIDAIDQGRIPSVKITY